MLPMRNVAGASASPVILQKTRNQPWDSDLPGRERKYWIVVLYDLLKVGKLDTPFHQNHLRKVVDTRLKVEIHLTLQYSQNLYLSRIESLFTLFQ